MAERQHLNESKRNKNLKAAVGDTRQEITIVKSMRKRRQEIICFIIKGNTIRLNVYTIYVCTVYLTRLSAAQTMERLMLT